MIDIAIYVVLGGGIVGMVIYQILKNKKKN